MEVTHPRRFFLEPTQTCQRQYEALRAVFVEDQPIDQVAQHFGYKLSTLRSMVSRFRADWGSGLTPPFFAARGEGDRPAPAPTDPARNRRKSPTGGPWT